METDERKKIYKLNAVGIWERVEKIVPAASFGELIPDRKREIEREKRMQRDNNEFGREQIKNAEYFVLQIKFFVSFFCWLGSVSLIRSHALSRISA